MNRFLSRKFIFAVIAVMMGFYLTITGTLNTDDFIALVKFMGFTYVAGNTISKFGSEE